MTYTVLMPVSEGALADLAPEALENEFNWVVTDENDVLWKSIAPLVQATAERDMGKGTSVKLQRMGLSPFGPPQIPMLLVEVEVEAA